MCSRTRRIAYCTEGSLFLSIEYPQIPLIHPLEDNTLFLKTDRQPDIPAAPIFVDIPLVGHENERALPARYRGDVGAL